MLAESQLICVWTFLEVTDSIHGFSGDCTGATTGLRELDRVVLQPLGRSGSARSKHSDLENSSVFSLCSIFHSCTRVVKFDKRYYSHASNASSQFVKEVVNKLVARTKMKIKLVLVAIVILGGLASLVYAQRSSAICPMHGVWGVPPEPLSTIEGNANTSIPWMEATQFIVFGPLATTKRVRRPRTLQFAFGCFPSSPIGFMKMPQTAQKYRGQAARRWS